MQRKKNIRLTVVLIILVTITAFVYYNDEDGNSLDIEKDAFALSADESAVVDRIVLKGKNTTNTLQVVDRKWTLNDQYLADQNMVQVLFAIFQQVKVRRKVASNQETVVSDALDQSGVAIEIYGNGEVIKKFRATGNQQNTLTYFENEDEEAYVVNIPGYNYYVFGVFQSGENELRDRIVFRLNWANLEELKLDHRDQDKDDFSVVVGQTYFEIGGLVETDTSKLNDFMDDISYLYIDQYLNAGENPAYDSLVQNQPLVSITAKDVGGNTRHIDFYERLKGDPYILTRIDSSQMALIPHKRASNLYRQKGHFLPPDNDDS
ncbi:MAG: DUF4340 domain-containing protein [Bacteroidota bacterium]